MKPIHLLLVVALLMLLPSLTLAEYKGDTRIPDYGSSAHERRNELGKSYPGDTHGTPYHEPKSSMDRYNEYQREQEDADQARRDRQRQQDQDRYKQQRSGY